MLLEIHTAIERLLREQGQISQGEVDISFEMPTREKIDSLVRPTINFFLFDIAENTDLRQAGMETMRYSESAAIQRMPPRRFDLHYMVSVLTTVAEDQYELLWGALAILLKHSPLPPAALSAKTLAALRKYAPRPLARFSAEVEQMLAQVDGQDQPLPRELLETPIGRLLEQGQPRPAELQREVQEQRKLGAYLEARMLPLATQVGRAHDGPRALDLWGALEVPPRPALFYVVTAPVDLEIASAVMTRVRRPSLSVDPGVTIGGVVWNARGAPLAGVRVIVEERGIASTTDDGGHYILRALRPGSYTLRIVRPGGQEQLVSIETEAQSHDIVLAE